MLECLVEPGTFRSVHAFIQGVGGSGRLEVLALSATAELDTDVAAATSGIEGMGLGGGGGTQPQPQWQQQQLQLVQTGAGSSSGFVAAASATAPAPRVATARSAAASGGTVVYPRGPVGGLPEEHASRRERFAELDTLQLGWMVELRSRGESSTIDAVFFSPDGECVGAFANARRAALKASKEMVAALAAVT